MLQKNAFVSGLDVQVLIDLALVLTITALLIVAVDRMETLAMAIVDLALSPIQATTIKDSRMVEVVIHQDLQVTIKEDQLEITKTSAVLEIKLQTTDLQETLREEDLKIIIMPSRTTIKKRNASYCPSRGPRRNASRRNAFKKRNASFRMELSQ